MTPRRGRVAIDCRTLQDRPMGGVGRSIEGQLSVLAEAVAIEALVDSRMPAPVGLPPGVPIHSLHAPLTARGFSWLQLAAPRWLRGFEGLFHCPFYGLPYYQPVPMVVTIHDLSFEFAPEWFPSANRFAFQRQARWAARTARWILVHSEHVRAMVLERYAGYGVTEERVTAVHMPVDPHFSRQAPGWEAAIGELGLTRPYVVALGGAQRRRLPIAIGAWGHALRLLDAEPAEIPLVVVGTEAPQPTPGVLYLGVLEDTTWAAVLRGAAAFCYATGYEGYGMPAIEAAASGTPIACARVGSLPEILDRCASWSEDESAREIGVALAAVLSDSQLAARLAAEGVARTQALPTWADVAATTLNAYRESLPA